MKCITIYTTNGCKECKRLKKILASRGIMFKEVTVDEHDSDLMSRFLLEDIYSFPVIEVKGVLYSGSDIFDESFLDQLEEEYAV